MQKVETSFVAPMVKETLSRIIARRFPAIKADVMLQNGPKG